MSDILRYWIENKAGEILSDEEWEDYEAAKQEARDKRARLIEVTYSFDDSAMIEDYTEPDPVVCVACGQTVTDDAGALVDETGGDVCTERGDDLPHVASDEKEGNN